MSWLCKSCNSVNSNLNPCCVVCKVKIGVIVLKSENEYYDLHESLVNQVLIYKLQNAELGFFPEKEKRKKMSTENQGNMSPKELLFAKFFSNEKVLVSDMDDMSLKAHIEELQTIAFEARARLTASDDEARERSAKKKASKGFSVSLQADDFTSNAINNINERQKKLTKVEKEIERLVNMGISREDAENMYKASSILIAKKQGTAGLVEDNKIKNIVADVMESSKYPAEKKEIVNPFALAKVEAEVVEVEVNPLIDLITPATTGVIVNIVEVEEVKPKFVNPFSKV